MVLEWLLLIFMWVLLGRVLVSMFVFTRPRQACLKCGNPCTEWAVSHYGGLCGACFWGYQ